jgi:rubrerythrin
MAKREAIEAALAAWREAERRQSQAVDGDRERLTAAVERHRDEFQRLSAEHMLEQIDMLKEAESRRAHATPSTPPFHEAARDAEAIWETARESDEDTPQTAANQATADEPTPRRDRTIDARDEGSRAQPDRASE